MAHNVLILSAEMPRASAASRKDLGLPAAATPGRRDERPADCLRCRVGGLTSGAAARLARALRRAGGSAGRAPGERHALVLQGGAAAFERFLRRARRIDVAAAFEIDLALRRAAGPPPPLLLRQGRLAFGRRTYVMGILNVTPDSFSDGGRFLDPRTAVRRALAMADEGADIIDVGGESTRPGSSPIGLREELRRVLPVLEALLPALRRRPGAAPLVSIDTTRSETARRAIAAGAGLINDISGLSFDPAMAAVAAEHQVPVVIQHIRGRPLTMQRAPRYGRLLPDVAAFLRCAIERALRAGLREDRIVIDPGLGFGKSRRHNLAILRHLGVLKSLGRPILVGASRKSFLGGSREAGPSARLAGSLAAEALAIAGGADIIRVHDVREAVRAARLCDAVVRGPSTQR
jgi:dihydropteroate synthase